MQLEISCLDRTSSFNDLSKSLYIAGEKKFNGLAVPLSMAADFQRFEPQLGLSVAVDFPYGSSVPSLTQHAIICASSAGAQSVEVCVNSRDLADLNFTKIRTDLKLFNTLCKERGVQLRLMIEYRLYDAEILLELARIAKRIGVLCLISATTTIADDSNDNIAVSYILSKKSKLPVICALSNCSPEQLILLKETGIYGVRLSSVPLVERLFGKLGGVYLAG